MSGYSIHIGLNYLDTSKYEGWTGLLRGAENDARSMEAIARAEGYSTILLLTEDATSARILEATSRLASTLTAGDILLITYSGHGGQIPDTVPDEKDGLDETWCFYDRMILDDEIRDQFSRFCAGVWIVVVSDSCHSGTIVNRSNPGWKATKVRLGFQSSITERGQIGSWRDEKSMPYHQCLTMYEKYSTMYLALQHGNKSAKTGSRSGATVLLLSACRDEETTADGFPNSAFTTALLLVLDDPSFDGNYRQLMQGAKRWLPASQHPRIASYGPDWRAIRSLRAFGC